jgi:hypothetical protein
MAASPEAHAEALYEVLSPLGRRGAAPEAELAPRLPALEGRTIAFVWDHVFHGDRMFERFIDRVSTDVPGLTFVPHEEFGNIHGTSAEEHEAVDLLPKRLAANGVDAALVGVGA